MCAQAAESSLTATGRYLMIATALPNGRSTPSAPVRFDPSADSTSLMRFVDYAFRNPRQAAFALVDWFDASVSNIESVCTSDAATLDDFARDPDADTADYVAHIARDRPYPLAVKVGLAAIVSGWRAHCNDDAVALDVLSKGWMANDDAA